MTPRSVSAGGTLARSFLSPARRSDCLRAAPGFATATRGANPGSPRQLRGATRSLPESLRHDVEPFQLRPRPAHHFVARVADRVLPELLVEHVARVGILDPPVELADDALLVLTPDVVAVRAAKRQIRLWERLQIRKAEETTTVVNRYGKGTEITPALVARITGTRVARTTVPAHYRELQSALDAGRVQDLDAKSTVKQALWGLAGELGLGPREPDRPSGRKRRGAHGDRGAVTLEFAGIFPLVLVVLALLWQCALYGYSYTLAGNAADEGARAATAAHAAGDSGPAACRTAATRHLPSAWSGATVTCTDAGSVWQATVKADVPLFFPGVNPGWKVTGRAGAAFEGER